MKREGWRDRGREEKRLREKQGGRYRMYKLWKEDISHMFNHAPKKGSRMKFLKVKEILLHHV